MIKIEHLKKEYPNVTPLKDVSVEIYDGDVISVIGPSGTGKSTLLRCINMLENHDAFVRQSEERRVVVVVRLEHTAHQHVAPLVVHKVHLRCLDGSVYVDVTDVSSIDVSVRTCVVHGTRVSKPAPCTLVCYNVSTIRNLCLCRHHRQQRNSQ